MDSTATYVYKVWQEGVEALSRLGLEGAVLAPGSRSAPLALSFLRSKVNCRVVTDERVAGYTALGWAKATERPVALVCSSGTAGLNFAPAIAEAYWQEVPLLVFTADRPAEWIGHMENQTLYQQNLYGDHVRYRQHLDPDYTAKDAPWQVVTALSQAVRHCAFAPRGPVHLNVPLREPLYPEAHSLTDKTLAPASQQEIQFHVSRSIGPEVIPGPLKSAALPGRILLLVGMNKPDAAFDALLGQLNACDRICLIADPLANLSPHVAHFSPDEGFLKTHLHALSSLESLKPDWIFSFGGPWVGKHIKTLFRGFRPQQHWRFDPSGQMADLFQNLTGVCQAPGQVLLEWLITRLKSTPSTTSSVHYAQAWREALQSTPSAETAMSFERQAVEAVLQSARRRPRPMVLHWGNSTPVRHWHYFHAHGLRPEGTEHYANRGTSGIDGCLSTAVGMAWGWPEKDHWLILGDLSYFYDRNGLFHNHLPSNLQIVVLNNQGGGIFRKLPGAAQQPELESYFTSPHKEHIVAQLPPQLPCQQVSTPQALDQAIHSCLENDQQPLTIIEVLC